MPYITYFADNSSMGDTSPALCDAYRAWALSELKREYPGYDVSVSSEQQPYSIRTDDEANRDSIEAFCKRLWETCPWDRLVVFSDELYSLSLSELKAAYDAATTEDDELGETVIRPDEDARQRILDQVAKLFAAEDDWNPLANEGEEGSPMSLTM